MISVLLLRCTMNKRTTSQLRLLQLIDAILQIQIQVSYVGYDPKTERWETQQQQAAKTSDLTELRMEGTLYH